MVSKEKKKRSYDDHHVGQARMYMQALMMTFSLSLFSATYVDSPRFSTVVPLQMYLSLVIASSLLNF